MAAAAEADAKANTAPSSTGSSDAKGE
jgi:hypothetical protein